MEQNPRAQVLPHPNAPTHPVVTEKLAGATRLHNGHSPAPMGEAKGPPAPPEALGLGDALVLGEPLWDGDPGKAMEDGGPEWWAQGQRRCLAPHRSPP